MAITSVEKWRASAGLMEANTRSVHLGMMQSILVALAMLLLLAGDVERNPGPVTGELTLDRDHYKVLRYIKELEDKQHQELGGALGLYYTKLKQMSDLPADMIAAWLRAEDDVLKTSGPPSWERLVKALREIGQAGIARKITEGEKLEIQASPAKTTTNRESTFAVAHVPIQLTQHKEPQHSSLANSLAPHRSTVRRDVACQSHTVNRRISAEDYQYPSRRELVKGDTSEHKGVLKSVAEVAGPVGSLQYSRFQDDVKNGCHGNTECSTSFDKSSDNSTDQQAGHLPFKEHQPIREYTKRNVLILGKKGTGKTTIIDHLIKEAKDDNCPTLEQAWNEVDCCWRVKSTAGTRTTLISLYEVDTPYDVIARSVPDAKKHYSEQLRSRMKNINVVNLIMLVIRHHYFTHEEKEIFECLTSCFTPTARRVCVLVVTGCENLSEKKRKEAKDQYTHDRDSSYIVRNVCQVVFSGLPRLEGVLPELKAAFLPGIEHDQKTLFNMIKDRDILVSREAIFSHGTVTSGLQHMDCVVQ